MSTLYVSDLDGTLLLSSEHTSEYTNRTLNELIENGLLFSYATARGFLTASKVTSGLHMRLPLVVHNGAMIVDSADGRILHVNTFGAQAKPLLDDLLALGMQPVVYAVIGGETKLSFCGEPRTKGLAQFVEERKNDPRLRRVENLSQLYAGDIYYFNCIDDEEKLRPVYEQYRTQHHCVLDREFYSKVYWLEIMPRTATKASAIKQLQQMLGCEKVVVFGDGINDIDMFRMADESYATAYDCDDLKQIAKVVIGSNDDNAVAKWLLYRCSQERVL